MNRRSGDDRRKGEQRVKPRFVNPPLECDQGRVIDLSAEGLRVELSQWRRLRVGDSVSLTLGTMVVPVRVVWLKGWVMNRTVGFAFESVSPELREMLGSVVAAAISTTTWFDSEPSSAA